MTMAVGSTAAEGAADTRWMAVPVAADPDDAAISLELEMQKAYAAFAAAEANSPGFVTSIPEVVAPSLEAVAPASSAAAEPGVPSPDPELANAMNAVASASAEALGGAVAELAAVAESHTDAPIHDALSHNGQSHDGQGHDAPSQDAPSDAPLQSEPSAAASAPETTSASAINERAEIFPGQDLAVAASPVLAEEPGRSPEQAIPLVADKAAEEPVAPPTRDAEPVVAEATAAHDESAVGGIGNMAEKTESELAESTAAAWASWRQIRETGQSQRTTEGGSRSDREFGTGEPAESAAMAVAAGAEKAPEEASATDDSDPAAIASIVDSVLADLRPKIVEEISRKLGKKK